MSAATQKSSRFRLGTRRSPLALAQAREARARLARAHGWDEAEIALVEVVASGDKVLDRPLADLGGKALWTRELDRWLIEGRIDAAVHSLKDVETIRPEAIHLGAVLERADPRDVLIGASSIEALPEGARVGTSAPRRAAQLLWRRPDCRIVLLRGNVQTRLAKLEAGEAEASFLAAAGLDRLGMGDLGTRLALEEWIPAASQGAIAIECRADDRAAREALAAIDHAPTRAEIAAERGVLLALGGDCHSAVGANARHDDGRVALTAAVWSEDGRERVIAHAQFAAGDAEAPRRVAQRLLREAGEAIRRQFQGATS